MKLLGLTGGIGSGKSTVARLFEKNGIPVIDADQIARELSQPNGAAHQAIQRRFGTTDRVALRELVFNDTQARKDLEAILHPLIQKETLKKAQEMVRHSRAGCVLYEAALLVETGRYQELDGLIVVECPAPLRLQRLVKQRGMDPGLAQKMIGSQATDGERRKAADYWIDNSASLESTEKQVTSLIKELLQPPNGIKA